MGSTLKWIALDIVLFVLGLAFFGHSSGFSNLVGGIAAFAYVVIDLIQRLGE